MRRTESGAAGVGGLLVGLCALLVVVGFVLPSGGKATTTGFEPMSAPARPVRLVVPALKVDAPVQPIRLSSSGVLDPPRNPRDVGWWQGSARPGAGRGQTVLTGHTVHTGGGVMDHLGRIRPGMVIRVVTPKGTMVYRATSTRTLSKTQVTRQAQQLFGQGHGGNRLVLVTCSGWTGSYYTSNVVVLARPLGVRSK